MEALCRIGHRHACKGVLLRQPFPFLDGIPQTVGGSAMAMSTVVDPEEEAKIAARKKKKEKDKARKAGTSAPAAEAKESTGEKRLGELIRSCLNVPPPRRHIKVKERMREQMLEKYGLLTKERQRELETEKARQKAVQARARGEPVSDEFDEPSDVGPDEAMRLAKEYSRFMMRHHRQRQIGETLRLKLKLAAIEALPPRLKEAAKVPDLTPFPGTPPATLTPPIKGYYHRYVRKEEKTPDFSDLS